MSGEYIVADLTFVIYIFSFGFVLFSMWKTNKLIELIPSFFWLALMILPYEIQKGLFHESSIGHQTFGVFFFGFIFLLTDKFSLPIKFNIKHKNESTNYLLKFAYIITIGIVFVQIYHLLLMPEIPFIEKILNPDIDSIKLSKLREAASKQLGMSLPLVYICQATVLMTPIIAMVFIKEKKYITSTVLLLLCVFYSISTTAKGPIVSFVFVGFWVVFAFANSRYKKILGSLMGVVFVVVTLLGTVYILSNRIAMDPLIEETEVLRKDFDHVPISLGGKKLRYSLGDHIRVGNTLEEELFLGSKFLMVNIPKMVLLNSYLLRIFIVPSEVSNRWYQYYQQHDKIGLYGLTPSTRNSPEFQHPANKIGIWAYTMRWPICYGESISAYASVDADAYARWGLMGIILIGLLVGLIRISIKCFLIENSFSKSIYLTIIALIGYTMPVSSFFAFLAAHGIIFFMIMLFAIFIIFYVLDNTAKNEIKKENQSEK
jgi:hypothetical protein